MIQRTKADEMVGYVVAISMVFLSVTVFVIGSVIAYAAIEHVQHIKGMSK